MKNNKKDFFKKYKWIIIWGIISVLFMFLIHILFHIEGPKWLEAKWTAGEILTYVSTVSLGLLALWQNQKIEYEHLKNENYNLATSNCPLFDFELMEAIFYKDGGSSIEVKGKEIERGFNGNIAIFKLDSFNAMGIDKLILKLIIYNIGVAPATDLFVTDMDGNIIEEFNVLTSNGEENKKKYILNNNSGQVIINCKLDDIKQKQNYYLNFSNQFGSNYRQLISVVMSNNKLILINAQCKLEIKEN